MKEKELVGFSSVSNEELVNVDGGIGTLGIILICVGCAVVGAVAGYLINRK